MNSSDMKINIDEQEQPLNFSTTQRSTITRSINLFYIVFSNLMIIL